MKGRLSLAVIALLAVALAAPAHAQRRKRKPVGRGARVAVEQKQRPGKGDLRRSNSVATRPTLEDRLREELDAIWGSRILRRGVTAVYVVDARTGDELFAVHPDDKLNPASNVKLISTATVLDALGPSWRYTTKLFGPAPAPDGVLRGSLYLRGSGDPTFGRPALDELAAAVAARGVTKIEGDVVLSDHLLRDTIGGASIDLAVAADRRPGEAPTVALESPSSFVEVVVSAKISTRRRAQLAISSKLVEDPATGPRMVVEVGGTIRQGQRRTIRRSVERRSSYTAHALREALAAAGVEVVGRPRLAAFEDYVAEAGERGYLPVVLARHRSATLQKLVAQVNKRSINWLADRLLMTAGAEIAGEGPSMGAGIKAMRQWLARAELDPDHLVVDTGSGLSYATKMSARQIVRVLRVATGLVGAPPEASLYDPGAYRESLAVGGVDGTLRGRFTRSSLKGQVLGKTGTLTGCIALAGLVSGGADDGLCFAIVTNGNRHRARTSVRREHDQMVVSMRRYLEARATERAVARAAAEAKAVAGASAAIAPSDAMGAASASAAPGDASVHQLVPSVGGQPRRPDALPASP